MFILEVIATNLTEARAAQAGGAHSVELCVDLAVGGLTPPLDMARAVRDAVTIDLNLMIRPHALSFTYSPHDIEAILSAADAAAQIGVSSIVFGALTASGGVDMALTQQVKAAARGVKLTFHRALDEANSPAAAVEALKGTAERLLCSGGAPNIWQGREQMGAWVRQHGDAFSFACAGGVTLDNLEELVRVTAAPEYHVGGAARTSGTVDLSKVHALIAILDRSRL
jgi:copper homeostasis protein